MIVDKIFKYREKNFWYCEIIFSENTFKQSNVYKLK